MSIKDKKYIFINWSCCLSPNVIDWFRSIYFSLFGSSALTLCLKFSTLTSLAFVSFTSGVLLFFIGVFMSISIANRFKIYEKKYEKKTEDYKLKNRDSAYYYEQETDTNSFQLFLKMAEHFSFYTLWIPALLCIYFGGFYIENQITKNSSETKYLLHKVEFNVNQIGSQLNSIKLDYNYKLNQLQDSLNLAEKNILKQNKKLDSFKNVIFRLKNEHK